MLKKIIIAFASFLVIIAVIVFIYRYQILRYSADVFIRKHLPSYVRVDKINFDARDSRVVLNGFKILNPSGFSANYLLEIEEISCRYKLKGKDITQGFEIFEPVFEKYLLNIERLNNGRLNLNEMGEVVKVQSSAPTAGAGLSAPTEPAKKAAPAIRLSDIVKLPENFSLKNGKVIFIDRLGFSAPHIVTFENIEAALSIKLDENYSRILSLNSTGQGNINGHRPEIVKWAISLDPTTPKLTMSNRFEVSDVEIKPFEPYYDRYSPLVFVRGTFSGLLIFDFNNGDIGSSDEIRLKNIRFYVKQGYENAQFWQTTVPDLVKYFTSPYGEIVFDFKIKGDMRNPAFYLGPKSKAALTAMAIDKISSTIETMSKSGAKDAPKNDLEKAKQYIDMFRGLMNKK